MKIDFSRTINNLDGVPMQTRIDADILAPLTLARVVTESLLSADESSKSMSGAKKAELFALAMRVHAATEPIDLTPEQVSLIRERVGAVCTTLVCGRAFELLNG